MAGLRDDKKDVFAEAKSAGFDVKAIRAIIKLRKLDRETREEQEEMVRLYAEAIGL